MNRRASFLPGGAVLAALAVFAFAGPLLYRVDPAAIDLSLVAAPSGPGHPLGTDETGRDLLARLMAGGQVSLLVGLAAGLVALTLGTAFGALTTSRRRWLAAVTDRLLDAALAVPAFFVLLVIVTLFGGSPATLVVAIGATAWMGIARLVRAETGSLRERDYVTAGRALGASPVRLFLRHILPHLVPTLSAAAGIGVAQAVLTESALSFLGLGVAPPRASWGNMLSGAQLTLSARPALAVFPGLLIVATALASNAIAEAGRRRSETGWRSPRT